MTLIYFNDQLADFEDDEIVTVSYSSLSFGDLTTRGGVKTNNYRLPFTNNNKKIFENSELVQSGSMIPYRYLSIRVVVEGYEVFNGFGSVKKSKEYYECTSYSGLSTFYDIIKNKNIRDLYLTRYDHPYNDNSVRNSWVFSSGYVYAFCSYGKYDQIFFSGATQYLPVEYLKPHVFFSTVIKQIITDSGYSYQGKVFNDIRFRKQLILYNNFPDNVFINQTVILSQCLPDSVKQSTQMIDFLNMYGLMMDINEADKILTFNFIDDTLLNDPLDWSDKIDDSEEISVEYSFDNYGKTNLLSFKTDDNFTEGKERYVDIDDSTLDPEGTIYQSNYYLYNNDTFRNGIVGTSLFTIKNNLFFTGIWDDDPSYTYYTDNVVFYQGSYYKSTDTIIPNEIPGGASTKWVLTEEKSIWDIKVRPMYGYIESNDSNYFQVNFVAGSEKIAKIVTDKNMDWDYTYVNYYRLFNSSLDKTKKIELLLKLSTSDINQIDFSKLIYFSRYHNYFIIDEIKEFKINSIDSTSVSLIRVSGSSIGLSVKIAVVKFSSSLTANTFSVYRASIPTAVIGEIGYNYMGSSGGVTDSLGPDDYVAINDVSIEVRKEGSIGDTVGIASGNVEILWNRNGVTENTKTYVAGESPLSTYVFYDCEDGDLIEIFITEL